MNNIMLITAIECRTMCPEINNEIESGIIDNAIKLCQQSVIKPSVGQEWFDQIILQKSGGIYSAENKVIVDNYLKWILAYATWQYLVITLSLQMNSAGLRIKSSDHSIAAESKDLQYYREFIQNWIDNTRKTMFRYINDNANSYPLYWNDKYGDKPKNNQYNWQIGSVGGIRRSTIQTYHERK